MLKRSTLALLLMSLLIGTALRFAWTNDVEYKGDEKQMFHWSQAVGKTEPWPTLGMSSSGGLPNPGMSVWVFVVLARLTGAITPPELTEAVIFLNVAALFLLAALVLKRIESEEREAWLWALALASVNPVAIQLQRKIWAQSALPLFCALFLWAWFGRRRPAGAFFWGLVGTCLGQIHMSGFFYAAALALWTAVGDFRSARWRWWLLGSCLGAIPLAPWISFASTHPGSITSALPWSSVLELTYWWFWLLEPLGYSLRHSLGPTGFSEFLREPLLVGRPTYLVAFAQGVSFAIGALCLGWALIAFARRKVKVRAEEKPQSRIALNSAAYGFGGLLTLTRTMVYRHYLIVAYPLQYVFFSRQALRFPWSPRTLLALMWIAQLAISLCFLSYIHTHNGSWGGDYGISFGGQQGKILLP
ncbi:MAG: hypothetical protein ACXWR1_09135 [Bdellovibrionota bacterium]